MTDSRTSWAGGSTLLALDFETTGLDPHRDRIVTAALVAIQPGAPPVTRQWLVDPGVRIPADATAIHHVTTEHARAHGRPAPDVLGELADDLAARWTPSTPLCVVNAAYDLTMLDRELYRHHEHGLELSGPVVDPQCIDRHLDPGADRPRNLTALCEHHQVRLTEAHDCVEDALAAARLTWKLAHRYPEIGMITPQQLHERQARWFDDQQHAYADRKDAEVRELVTQGSEPEKVVELRLRSDTARFTASAWPVLPELPGAFKGTKRNRRTRPGGPVRSHESWTATLDAEVPGKEWDPDQATTQIVAENR